MASGTPITYKVTRITPDTQFPPGEQPVKGQLVAFTTSTDYSDSVFIPNSVFNDTAAMRRLIEDKVRQVAAAMLISGSIQGL